MMSYVLKIPQTLATLDQSCIYNVPSFCVKLVVGPVMVSCVSMGGANDLFSLPCAINNPINSHFRLHMVCHGNLMPHKTRPRNIGVTFDPESIAV